MKKVATLLCINTFIFTCITGMEMDVENDNNNSPNKTSKHNNKTTKTKNNHTNQTDLLLQQNNILLHTLIMQNKIHFEYEDDKKYTTNITINQHAQNTQKSLDNLYKAHNEQLKDKTLHIPMTGKTTIATAKDKNTQDTI